MSTETATNPETGVAGQGDNAPSDDIDTEAFDRMEVPDDDETEPKEPVEGEAGEGDDGDQDKPQAGAEDDDHVEVERAGQKYKVPKALHGEFLMQADYTKKTTEHAQAVRSFEEERQTWESQREQSRAALPEEHAQVAVIGHQLVAVDKQLEEFKSIDWDTWRSQVATLADDDPNKLRYARYRDAYMAARDSRIDLGDKLGAAKQDLQTKEDARLTEQRTKAEEAIRQARQETGRVLAAEVKGWNTDLATQTVQFANDHLGIAPEEMADATDPRVWKALHGLRTALAEVETLKTALKQQKTAANHEKAQSTTPAATPKGTGASARDPATPRGDGLSVDEWMRRRNAKLAKA